MIADSTNQIDMTPDLKDKKQVLLEGSQDWIHYAVISFHFRTNGKQTHSSKHCSTENATHRRDSSSQSRRAIPFKTKTFDFSQRLVRRKKFWERDLRSSRNRKEKIIGNEFKANTNSFGYYSKTEITNS